MDRELENLKKLWHANETILRNLEDAFFQFHSRNPDRQFNEWEYLVGSAFHLVLHRFKGIQFLMNPTNNQNFYMEAASLSRNLFETWLTLAWLDTAEDEVRQERVEQFKNASMVTQSRINSPLSFSGQELRDVQDFEEQVLEIKKLPKKQWEMPSAKAKLEKIASTRDSKFKDSVSLYYDTVYRDLSQYVHLSYRTIREMRRSLDSKKLSMVLSPSLGFKCIDVAGGFFIFTAEIWNDVFHAAEEAFMKEWTEKWLKVQIETRKEAPAK